MSSKFVAKTVVGAIALALAGTAAAGTFNTDDLYLNIVNYTGVSNGVETGSSSYVADLGVTLGSFNPDQSYSFNLNDDTSFSDSVYAGVGSSTLYFSIVGAGRNGSGITSTYTVYTTTNTPSSTWAADTVNKTGESGAYSYLTSFQSAIGASTNTFTTGGNTVNSEVLTNTSGNYWGQGAYEGGWSNNALNVTIPPWADGAAPGTPLSFYTFTGTTLQTLGTWSLSAGILTYTPLASAVPLPAPLLLLLSGLGLMGLVARRGKGLAGGFGAAA